MPAPDAAAPVTASMAVTSISSARFGVIALTAFVTVVDLFAAQAILPALRASYGTTPAMMGAAVNASTIGMAIGGFATALLSHRIERRRGIMLALALLAIPTLLLGQLPSLAVFAVLRVLQGLCMAAAFTLMLAYLGEVTAGSATPAAFAAYITGNVASNLVGRLMAAGVADHLGLGAVFQAFALLNLCGALLVAVTVTRKAPPAGSLDAGAVRLGRAFAQQAFARGFRPWLLHPVRVHRHVHLRQLRAGAGAAVAGDDAGRVRLFRIPAVHPHDAARGHARAPRWNAVGRRGSRSARR